MTLVIACPNCQMSLSVPKEFEGATGICRGCGKLVKANNGAPPQPVAAEAPATEGENHQSFFDRVVFRRKDDLSDWIPVDASTPGSKYRSDKRVATIRVFTQAGWIIGNVQLSPETRLIDYLNQTREFIPMIDVFLEGRPKPLDSFALHKSAVYFLATMDMQEKCSAGDVGNLADRAISCLLPVGSLYGSTRIQEGLTTANYFSNHTGFVLVCDCHYRVRGPWRQTILDDTEEAVLLNAGAIIGISDSATTQQASQ